MGDREERGMTLPSLIAGAQHSDLRDAIQLGALRFTWRGVPCWKDPFDLAIYSMLLFRERPGTIIEIGSAHGGSALWLNDMLRVMGIEGQVISIDTQECPLTSPMLTFLRGNACDLSPTLDAIMPSVQRPLLVIEDSSHEAAATAAVMRYFHTWLRPGEMIVIEDGNANDLYPGRFPCGGPLAGVASFMADHGAAYSQAVEYRDFFGINVTWNLDGYWRRIEVPATDQSE
jgi:cephalosporin hydroxylase